MSKTEEKYYTPEIEEFRVGFEYYMPLLKEDEKGDLYIDDFVKHIWHESDNMWEYFNASYDGNNKKTVTVPNVCRVKYLDREDIESFGWKFLETERCSDNIVEWDLFEKVDYEHKNHGMRLVDDRTVMIVDYDDDGGMLFIGKIANKSEFATLLKQLGI